MGTQTKNVFPRYFFDECYIRVSTHIAGLAAKPNDVLDTLDLTNFGVKTLLVYWSLFRYN